MFIWAPLARQGPLRQEGAGFYDHTTTWLSRTTGRPALVFNQPYEPVDPAEVQELISEYPSLTAEVGPESWYGSATLGVYIWNDGNRS